MWKDHGLEDQPGVAARPGIHAEAGLLLQEGQGAGAGAGEPGQRNVELEGDQDPEAEVLQPTQGEDPQIGATNGQRYTRKGRRSLLTPERR